MSSKQNEDNEIIEYLHPEWIKNKKIDKTYNEEGRKYTSGDRKEEVFKYRYSLTIDFNDDDKNRKSGRLVVIAMNPSKADDCQSDETVEILIEHAHEAISPTFKVYYSGLIVLNVFPLYETNSERMVTQMNGRNKDVHSKYQYTNLEKIKNILSNEENKRCDVIIAWGVCMSKENPKDVKSIIEYCKGHKIYNLCKGTYPPHPLYILRDKDNNKVLKTSDFDEIKEKYYNEYEVKMNS